MHHLTGSSQLREMAGKIISFYRGRHGRLQRSETCPKLLRRWPFMEHNFGLQTPSVSQSFPGHTRLGMKGQQPWGEADSQRISHWMFSLHWVDFSTDGFPVIATWLPPPKSVSWGDIGWTWKPCGLLEARRAPHILSTPPDPYLLQMFHDGCQDFPPTIWTMSQMTNWQTIFPEPWYTSALFWWKSARACKVLMVMGACCLLPHIQSSRLEYY